MDASPEAKLSSPSRQRWLRFALVVGPGVVVMLADTDAGSIITAAQSGAEWGYRLLLLQIVLIPVLYVVQELTVRLGIVSGKGHAELIKEHFGRGWAWLSVGTLVCIWLILINGRFEYQWFSFIGFLSAGIGGLWWVLNGDRQWTARP